MEEQTIVPHPDYLKGFNEGYLIARHMPDLSGQLSKIESNSERLNGMQDGRKQLLLEKLKDRQPNWLKEGNNKQESMETAKDRSKEDIEPEL